MNKKLCFAIFALALLTSLNIAHATPRAILGDYNGDGFSDLVVTRDSGLYKYWYIRYSSSNFSQPIFFGLQGDQEVAADFDGDGDIAPGVTRPTSNGFNIWYSLTNTNLVEETSWGLTNDTFQTGYFDSDTKADLVAIRKESNNYLSWYIRRSSDLLASVFYWGISGDTPFIGNLDGDTINDPIVVRKVNGFWRWFVKSSQNGAQDGVVLGIESDKLLPPADLDGNGVDDFIVYRTVGIYVQVYVRFNNADSTASSISTFAYGLKNDVFNVGNFLSTSTSNVAVFRNNKNGVLANNLLRTVDGGALKVDFGLGGDTLINTKGLGLPTSLSSSSSSQPVTAPPTTPSTNGLSSICTSIKSPKNGFLWKPSSDDSGGSRQGRPMVAWKNNPPASKSCIKVFATNGQQVSQFGRYSPSGQYGARFYSGWTCGDKKSGAQIAAAATSATGSSQVYIEGPGSSCVGPITPTSRTGNL